MLRGELGVEVLCVPTPGPAWSISRVYIQRHFICWGVRTTGTWNWEMRSDQSGTSAGGRTQFPLCVAINLLSPDDNAQLFSSRSSRQLQPLLNISCTESAQQGINKYCILLIVKCSSGSQRCYFQLYVPSFKTRLGIKYSLTGSY